VHELGDARPPAQLKNCVFFRYKKMMASNNSVVRDPTTGRAEYLVEAKCYLDGFDLERKPCFQSVRVEVMAEDGTVKRLTVPYTAGSLRGVGVDELAKRLGTDADCIIVM